jgi:NAD(P)-dependent dehydrogenase (short-subunit alcohol dehydrogenase family)
VLPGTIPTNINRQVQAGEGVTESIVGAAPLKKLGDCEDIAAAVTYLASDERSGLRGTLFVVAALTWLVDQGMIMLGVESAGVEEL